MSQFEQISCARAVQAVGRVGHIGLQKKEWSHTRKGGKCHKSGKLMLKRGPAAGHAGHIVWRKGRGGMVYGGWVQAKWAAGPISAKRYGMLAA